MKKLATVFMAFAFVASSANQQLAQSPQLRCALTEANAPSIRGLQLGMNTQQLITLFPAGAKRKEVRDALDRGRTSSEIVYAAFDPTTDARGDEFAGVASVVAGLQKDRVVDYSVTYAGTTWGSIDEWVAKLAETFKLPGARQWVVGPSENPNKVLKCSDIEIGAGVQGGGSSVRIRTAEAAKAASQASSGDDNKRFKP